MPKTKVYIAVNPHKRDEVRVLVAGVVRHRRTISGDTNWDWLQSHDAAIAGCRRWAEAHGYEWVAGHPPSWGL